MGRNSKNSNELKSTYIGLVWSGMYDPDWPDVARANIVYIDSMS